MSVSSVDPDLHDINLHIKPGKTRAPFFRYFRFNLPRLTRGLLCVVIAIPGAVAAAFAQSDIFIFEGQNAVFYLLAAVSAIFVVLGLCSAWRLWDFGLIAGLGSIFTYLGGVGGQLPTVDNGASVYAAAGWNLFLFCGIAYLLLYWALNYGMIVAYPDDQGFED
ncbi:hypothetical protein [Corynebacterium striatum]|uniref:hypothetical protein n=1 Tax=Corynebacterium striatum TaxID=43770 RepID=UPI003B5CD549